MLWLPKLKKKADTYPHYFALRTMNHGSSVFVFRVLISTGTEWTGGNDSGCGRELTGGQMPENLSTAEVGWLLKSAIHHGIEHNVPGH